MFAVLNYHISNTNISKVVLINASIVCEQTSEHLEIPLQLPAMPSPTLGTPLQVLVNLFPSLDIGLQFLYDTFQAWNIRCK